MAFSWKHRHGAKWWRHRSKACVAGRSELFGNKKEDARGAYSRYTGKLHRRQTDEPAQQQQRRRRLPGIYAARALLMAAEWKGSRESEGKRARASFRLRLAGAPRKSSRTQAHLWRNPDHVTWIPTNESSEFWISRQASGREGYHRQRHHSRDWAITCSLASSLRVGVIM